jgi:plasmid stability protein
MSKSLRVNIDEDLHQKVRYKALALNTTVAAVIRKMLTDWVEKEKPIVLPTTDQPEQ